MSHPPHTHSSVCYGLFDWPVCVSVVCMGSRHACGEAAQRWPSVESVCVCVCGMGKGRVPQTSAERRDEDSPHCYWQAHSGRKMQSQEHIVDEKQPCRLCFVCGLF